MKKLKRVLHAVFFLPLGAIFILIPPATALLIFCLVYMAPDHPLSCFAYALSAYTLTALCLKTPHLIRVIHRFKNENRYMRRYLQDPRLRARLSLYISLLINLLYAIFQLGLGFYHRTVWFHSLAVYYILLCVMRFFLLKDLRQKNGAPDITAEYRRYRFCGILLAIMTLTLSVIVFYIAWQKKSFTHHPITTIAMAAYTFFSLTTAIINAVKTQKYQSPVLSAFQKLRLASASVSMLTLESAMLSAFGSEEDAAFQFLMTGITGAAVCLFVLTIGVYMIVYATKQLHSQPNPTQKDYNNYG